MPAPKRIPDAAVIGAIQKWRGNVEAAAEELRIAPVNLRKRLASLGVDLSLLRATDRYRTSSTHRNVSNPNPLSDTLPTGELSRARIFSARAKGSTLRGMTTTATALAINDRARSKPTRLTPPHEDRLREAKFDLQARYRAEIGESQILEQFFADEFEGWIKRKLAAKSPVKAEGQER